MNKHVLYFPALVVATTGGATVALGALYPVGIYIRPVTYLCATTILILFVRMLFDPRCHRGIEAANREMQGSQLFRARWPKLKDPKWGLFGSGVGDRPLLVVRAVLFCEFAVTMLFGGVRPDLTLLAGASFGVAMLLSLLHASLQPSVNDPKVR